jgi:hypothetical protein
MAHKKEKIDKIFSLFSLPLISCVTCSHQPILEFLLLILLRLLLHHPSHRTSYDASTRQHWLSVYRSKIKLRFLVKDSTTTAATSSSSSNDRMEPSYHHHSSPKVTTYKTAFAEAEKANDRIRAVVDHMIETLSLPQQYKPQQSKSQSQPKH